MKAHVFAEILLAGPNHELITPRVVEYSDNEESGMAVPNVSEIDAEDFDGNAIKAILLNYKAEEDERVRVPVMGAKEALGEAVQAIYFADNSDYEAALWKIVELLGGKAASELLEADEQAAYEKYAGHLDTP